MQENLKHKCSRPYETKKIWSSARHHMETALPRLGSKIMLHIRLMIFRHLNDSEEIRKRAGLRPAFYDKNGETEKHQRILPSPSWWPAEIPFHLLKVPTMRWAAATPPVAFFVACRWERCPTRGQQKWKPGFWFCLCFFEFHLASLMVTMNTATCAIASSPICAFSCSGSCIRQKYCPWAVSENVPRALQANNLVT